MNLPYHLLATPLFEEGHTLIAIAAALLMGTVIWHLATGIQPKIRNAITAMLLTGIMAATVYILLTHESFKPVHMAKGKITQTGGTMVLLKIQPGTDPNGHPIAVSAPIRKHTIDIIKKRLIDSGNKGFFIEAQGTDRIYLEFPGLDQDKVPHIRSLLEKSARLELKLVHPNNRILADRVAADPDNEIVPGYELNILEDEDEEGQVFRENILLKKRTALTGAYIIHAQELYGPHEGKLTVKLSSAGGDKMYDLTRNMRHGLDRLAVVLDDKVLSAPTVQSTLGRMFEISGMKDAAEARSIATALLNPLQHPLQHPLRIEEIRTISPEKAQKSTKNR